MALRASTAALALLCCFAGCGGKNPPAHTLPGLCRVDTKVGAGTPPGERKIPPPYFAVLMLSGYQASGAAVGQVARPARDCTGQIVTWTADACTAARRAEPVEPQPINDKTIFISNAGEGRRLVWVPTDYLDSGEAIGPVALTDFDDGGIVALTMGTLRAFPSRVDMRLEPVGDGQVLVVESERCPEGADAQQCERGTRVLVAGRQRFVGADLVDENGGCAGRAFFPRRLEGEAGEGATRRRYDMRSSVSITKEAIVVHEELTLTRERVRGSADAAAAAVSRLEGERRIALVKGRLVVATPSVLETVLAKSR